MPAKSSEGIQQANFVFKGTVKKLKAATMKSVPVDPRTAVVQVDQVIEAPKNLAGYAGQNITVRLAGKAKVSPGQEMIFHTSGWIFGDSVAVQAAAQEAVKKTDRAMLSRAGDPVQMRRHREMQKRFEDADVVVSGVVSSVRPPSQARQIVTRGVGAAAEAPAPARVSEHDPKWREAVVEVEDVHKGQHTKKKIIVRFPSSTDVRWYKAPKFRAGQKGVFMLHKSKATKKAPAAVHGAAAAAIEPEEEVYVALHPSDYQPSSEQKTVLSLSKSKTEE